MAESLNQYVKDMVRYPLLTKEEEENLFQIYLANKNIALKNKLINHNLRLVIKIAREFNRPGYSLIDLIQEGNIGLVNAVERFDPTKGVFSAYASLWIRAYLFKYLLDNARMVRLGKTKAQRKLFYNLSKERAKLEAQGIFSDAEVAAKIGVREQDVTEMDSRLGYEMSIDNQKFDTFASDDLPHEAFEEAEVQHFIRQKLDVFKQRLNSVELQVLDERLLHGDTLKEVGERLHVTRQRVSQIEIKLVQELTQYFRRFKF